MAFIEPMHRNKPNITYLLTVKIVLVAVNSGGLLQFETNLANIQNSGYVWFYDGA